MWFKNVTVYDIKELGAGLSQSNDDLKKHEFTPLTGQEFSRSGLVPPADGGFTYTLGNFTQMAVRTDRKLLPGSVVAEAVRIKAAEIEEREGYRPGRKQMREIKEEVTDTLLVKAFSVSTVTRVLIDSRRGLMMIDTASATRADAVVAILMRCFDELKVVGRPKFSQSPASAITGWLAENEAPEGFTVDQEAELVGRGESGSKVKYSKHSLEGVEIQDHIRAGKTCTQLAMTWRDRVSFVLTDSMTIKRIKPLDVIMEQSAAAGSDAEDRFKSDMTLMTGELGHMLDDLTDAFGGRIPHSDE